MADKTVLARIDGRIGILTFNRPSALNAFSSEVVEATNKAFRELSDDPAVRAIVVHGAGRAFSAGFDLKEGIQQARRGVEAWRRVLEADFDFIVQFWDSPKPTIAAVHGYCLAGAFELALACDVTIAGEGTRFGPPDASSSRLRSASAVFQRACGPDRPHEGRAAPAGGAVSAARRARQWQEPDGA